MARMIAPGTPEADELEASKVDAELVPQIITMRQAMLEMSEREWITEAEAMAWIKREALPAVVEQTIDSVLADEKARFRARLDAIGATHIERGHFMVEALATVSGHGAHVDDFFIEAAKG